MRGSVESHIATISLRRQGPEAIGYHPRRGTIDDPQCPFHASLFMRLEKVVYFPSWAQHVTPIQVQGSFRELVVQVKVHLAWFITIWDIPDRERTLDPCLCPETGSLVRRMERGYAYVGSRKVVLFISICPEKWLPTSSLALS